MPEKIFLTLDEQIKHLNDDKGILCTQESKENLLRIGYFNLVNGYKTPFSSSKDKDGNHIYASGATIDQLISLKIFDDELRYLLIKTLTKCEEEIKTIFSYVFEKTLAEGLTWKSTRAYDRCPDHSNDNEIQKLISRMEKQLKEREDLEYIKFYKKNHSGKFPMWIITKAIYFGTFIDLVELSKANVSDTLCEIYNVTDNNNANDKKLLIGSLHWIRIFRNACAHNERIYCLHAKGRIYEKEIRKFGKRYTRNNERKLFDLLIYLRYYLQKEEFKNLIKELKGKLNRLELSVSKEVFDNIRGGMGIKQMGDLDVLSKDAENNNYTKVY